MRAGLMSLTAPKQRFEARTEWSILHSPTQQKDYSWSAITAIGAKTPHNVKISGSGMDSTGWPAVQLHSHTGRGGTRCKIGMAPHRSDRTSNTRTNSPF